MVAAVAGATDGNLRTLRVSAFGDTSDAAGACENEPFYNSNRNRERVSRTYARAGGLVAPRCMTRIALPRDQRSRDTVFQEQLS